MEKLVPVHQVLHSCHNQWRSPFVSRHSHTVHLDQYQTMGQGRPKINRYWTQSSSCVTWLLKAQTIESRQQLDSPPNLNVLIPNTSVNWKCRHKKIYLLLYKSNTYNIHVTLLSTFKVTSWILWWWYFVRFEWGQYMLIILKTQEWEQEQQILSV